MLLVACLGAGGVAVHEGGGVDCCPFAFGLGGGVLACIGGDGVGRGHHIARGRGCVVGLGLCGERQGGGWVSGCVGQGRTRREGLFVLCGALRCDDERVCRGGSKQTDLGGRRGPSLPPRSFCLAEGFEKVLPRRCPSLSSTLVNIVRERKRGVLCGWVGRTHSQGLCTFLVRCAVAQKSPRKKKMARKIPYFKECLAPKPLLRRWQDGPARWANGGKNARGKGTTKRRKACG